MSEIRRIKRILKSKPTTEGAGVHLKRAFGYHQIPQLDPFLLLDDFRSDNSDFYIKGFPWHPHRGIETITYMIDGYVEHGDSMGNKGVISKGGVQWMTAGSGVIHQEMPKGHKKGLMGGFQLWANLPKNQKMMDPRYREITKNNIPEVSLKNGVKIKVICGKVEKTQGPVKDIVIDPEYLDIFVPPKTNFSFPTKRGYTVFAYIIDGEGYFDPQHDSYAYEIESINYFDFKRECLIKNQNLIIFEDGDEITVMASEKIVRFLLISGKPLKEPIAWYGPVVMNTQEELRIAFEEYEKGTFIKQKKKIKV